MDEFKIGMVVQFKSGGPKMTVSEIETEREDSLFCLWFSGSKREGGYFHPETLIIVKEE